MRLRNALLTGLAVGVLLAVPSSALAAGPHALLVSGGIFDWLGGVFSSIGHAVLGAFTWTIGLAAKFILTTIAALVRMLIPHSWVHKGLQIMEWIVAVPNYAGTVSSPAGGHVYGFAGINALRDLFMWLGVAVAPLALVYATSRAMLGESEPVGLPTLRVLALAAVIVSYPYWWQETAALADQVTHVILTLPAVSRGLYKLMEYAVDGVALGGWQLIDLGLMGAIGLELLGLIFLKVAVILLGALLYATGPLMIGLVATEAGGAIARAWASAVGLLFALGICWALLFAVGALLIGDAGTAGPLIAGSSDIGSLFGGLLLAIAGLASLWLCLKAGREASGLLRMQLAGLLVLSRHATRTVSTSSSSTRMRTTGQSLRDYGALLAKAASAAGGELALAGAGSGAVASGGRAVGTLGRRGLLGSAAAGVRSTGVHAAPHAGALLGRSRAGAVAVRMARAGTASWQQNGRAQTKTRAAPPAAAAGTGANGQSRARGGAGGATSQPAKRTSATVRQPSETAGRASVVRVRTGSDGTQTRVVRADPAPGVKQPQPGASRQSAPGAQPPGRAPSASTRSLARPTQPPSRTSSATGGPPRSTPAQARPQASGTPPRRPARRTPASSGSEPSGVPEPKADRSGFVRWRGRSRKD